MKKSTEQVSKRKKTPQERNPTGKGGFADNPQNRNPGGWKKENSLSYQYRRFLAMSVEEFRKFDKKPESEKTMAEENAYYAVLAGRRKNDVRKEIADRTEGKAPQHFTFEGDVKNDTTLSVKDEVDEMAKSLLDAVKKRDRLERTRQQRLKKNEKKEPTK